MKTSLSHGFTIIEVVLVLAIAGLIFLMVFVGLPSLQRSQRDSQRRQDMSRVASALTQYKANNGNMPSAGKCDSSDAGNIQPNDPNTYKDNTVCKFISQYLNQTDSASNEFKDSDGTPYGIQILQRYSPGWKPKDDHLVSIVFQAKCDDSSSLYTYINAKEFFAILYKLEGSGAICIDNQ